MNRLKGLSLDSCLMLIKALDGLDQGALTDEQYSTREYLMSQLNSIKEYLIEQEKRS